MSSPRRQCCFQKVESTTVQPTRLYPTAPYGRYILAGTRMSLGPALVSGCSVDAGLSGTAVMATSSVVTLIFILLGGLISTRYSL
jgi:hypothetical protein